MAGRAKYRNRLSADVAGEAVRRYLAGPMGWLDLLDSPRFQFSRYRARSRRRFTLMWMGEPVSKNGPTECQIAFQTEVLSRLDEGGRRAFCGPVMVKLKFATSDRNAPQVQTLAKNYLDLLQAPLAQIPTRRSRLLLTNDANVEILTVDHIPNTNKPYVFLEVAPVRDVADDIDLFLRVSRGDWAFDFGDPFMLDDLEERRWDRFGDDLDEYVSVRKELQKRDIDDETRRRFLLLERMFLPGAQKRLLHIGRVTARQLGAILRSRRAGVGASALDDALDASVRAFWDHTFAIDVGGHPIREGDSKVYRETVARVVEQFRRANPILFPLRVPVTVTIVHVRPKLISIDLDNLARKLIGPIREAYAPPTTFLQGLTEDQIKDPKVRAMADAIPRTARSLVTRYEVYSCPRLAGDPVEGFARVGLAPVGFDATSAIDEIDRHLHDWSAKLR